ncbi:glycogen debranching enzyme [Vigna unguiculata]|uniref:Glycogen debranching enzyme n=1 Tax=Vigna unguiculata TaxID=3917 RepID=A0A4D6MCC2_VIGUN|nr:glycogen debranching enzyme [Vigna unguiculata]QCE01198.1 glycogen debranching enzyme [Vigna unguiculata]
MDINALLTSAGINIGLCVVLFSFYSVLRKQPSNVNVYFGRRLASQHSRRVDLCLERFVPSPSWILKAWETSEEEILAIGGLDGVVFVRMLVFSIRVFSIAAVICLALVLPINYHGMDRTHKHIPFESLEVFTIENVKEGSTWLWAHCVALYIITFSACTLLYIEYKSITNLRLLHIVGSPPNPSHFTILVRSVPCSSEESYCETVKRFFSHYHASAYLSHQMIYKSGKVQKLKDDAEHVCKVLKNASLDKTCKPSFRHCCSAASTHSFKKFAIGMDSANGGADNTDMNLETTKKECAAAFVFFKSRYAALMAAKVLQTPNPMLWVTDVAPEPHDIYWSNICVPYRQLWIRKIATLVASIGFMLVFLIPVTFVQGLTQLDKLQKMFPFLRGMLKEKLVRQVVTGYLPSVILVLFLCTVPPMMMLFSSVEGSISRSERKKSACCKVLYFTIWNVFFVNVFTGSVISQLSVFSSVTDLPAQLAKAVPSQATFFTTYVLSSGWASLACEVMQIFPLLCNIFQRLVLRLKEDALDSSLSFPYHTEVPRVLLFGFLGFTCSILAPLMLPFLLFYFFLAYLVYRNQIINVYITKYDSGGQFWPIAHNTTVFSLIFSQLIALGVFGLKRSSVASGFTIPLLIGTLLFHQYCRQRFLPIFKSNSAQIVTDMDLRDEHSGRMEEIYEHLPVAYNQPSLMEDDSSQPQCVKRHGDMDRGQSSSQDMEKGKELSQKDRPRPVQRSVSLNSDKSVLGLNL